jgi:NAD(P)-dependent dehydrogenase (short-subunit alcohol dehydrogenase family)
MAAKMKDKVVLITGGAVGIGYCVAENFANAGARLVLVDVREKDLKAAKTKLAKRAASVDTYVVDVSNQKQVDAMAADVLAKHGHLDVLVNNAGIGYMGEIADTPMSVWRKLMEVNFWGPLHLTYAFLPSMKERGAGNITNVSSGQAFFQLPTWGPYAAIKTALGVVSEILHWEVRKYGVTVTTVYPYMVRTHLYDEVKADTLGGKLSMALLPLYSQSPEKVGKIIFKAIKSGRRVEMVNVLNDFAKLGRVIWPVGEAISYFSNLFLASGKSKGNSGAAA